MGRGHAVISVLFKYSGSGLVELVVPLIVGCVCSYFSFGQIFWQWLVELVVPLNVVV